MLMQPSQPLTLLAITTLLPAQASQSFDTRTTIELSAIAAGDGGFIINGQTTGDRSGYSVSSAGDVNGDGLADLIIGAPNAQIPMEAPLAGSSYVVFGTTDTTTAIELSDIAAGTGGFSINGQTTGPTAAADLSAALVTSTADGLADLIIGAYWRRSQWGS